MGPRKAPGLFNMKLVLPRLRQCRVLTIGPLSCLITQMEVDCYVSVYFLG